MIPDLHVYILFSRLSSNFDEPFTNSHTAFDCPLGENNCPPALSPHSALHIPLLANNNDEDDEDDDKNNSS